MMLGFRNFRVFNGRYQGLAYERFGLNLSTTSLPTGYTYQLLSSQQDLRIWKTCSEFRQGLKWSKWRVKKVSQLLVDCRYGSFCTNLVFFFERGVPRYNLYFVVFLFFWRGSAWTQMDPEPSSQHGTQGGTWHAAPERSICHLFALFSQHDPVAHRCTI